MSLTYEQQLNLFRSLRIDKYTYCITGGFAMRLQGLRDTAEDIDILIDPIGFEFFSNNPLFTRIISSYKGSKTNNLILYKDGSKYLELMERDLKIIQSERIEFSEQNNYIYIIDMEKLLAWKLEHNRGKDQEDIKTLLKYSCNKRGVNVIPDSKEVELSTAEAIDRTIS